jgi:uncharacterized protein YjbI with pentapeptide repeats
METDLRGAWLNFTDLTGANCERADLNGASLIKASLSGANLGAVNLSGVNLLGADLSGADLRGANLDGAQLLKTQELVQAEQVDPVLRDMLAIQWDALSIGDTNLSGAIYDEDTVWPAGFAVPPDVIYRDS